MRLQPWILILLYAVNQGRALDDDKKYGKDATMVRLSDIDPNDPGIEEVTYTWTGVIKSMFSDEKDTCLTLDILNRYVDEKGKQFSEKFPKSGTGVGIFRCPGNLGDAPAYQKWFIKGTVYTQEDVEPVFEGIIRSQQVTEGGGRLCLTYREDPGRTPLTGWKKTNDGKDQLAWNPQAKFYDWDYQQDINPHPRFWNYHKFFTSWGVVSVSHCRPGSDDQIWHIGLSPDEENGNRRYPDDPKRWTWIRPKVMPINECIQAPNRDPKASEESQPDAMCIHRKDRNCKPNYSWHPGLMRPYIAPERVNDMEKVQWVMVGCSPSNWMPQQNFGLLKGGTDQIRDKIIKARIKDPRIAPTRLDYDFRQIDRTQDQNNFEPVGKEWPNFSWDPIFQAYKDLWTTT
ncbi:hypothetical protein TWF481_005266 [Arthrobotrys musiformis]|uniref:Uncharacterized protein n=1 Tax=Arthrobotrys musiformis TaxID=47236 RepID=A0AAV9WE48_9PEZI